MSRRLIFRYHRDERGLTNLAVAALALPILLLITTAAVDVMRLPMVKQHIRSAIHTSYDNIISTLQTASAEPAAGRDWCPFLISTHPEYSCDTCGAPTNPTSCVLGQDDGFAQTALDNAADLLHQQLHLGGGTGGFGFLNHEDNDIVVKTAIYNLIVGNKDPLSSGNISGQQEIATADRGAGIGLGVYDFAVNKISQNTFVTPGNIDIGHWVTSDTLSSAYKTHVPIVVFAVAVRVPHIFELPDGLRFAEESGAAGADAAKESVVTSIVIRPLPKSIRLSGSTLN